MEIGRVATTVVTETGDECTALVLDIGEGVVGPGLYPGGGGSEQPCPADVDRANSLVVVVFGGAEAT